MNFHKIEVSNLKLAKLYPFEMQIITSAAELFSLTSTLRFSEKKAIGFVPTMGALHQGHLSLIKKANEENDFTVCSIFVNPTQFTNSEDFEKYPRNYDKDIEKLKKSGCQVLFLPEVEEMYNGKNNLEIHFGEVEHVMEGKFRKGHFSGVATIVSKFFHLCNPTRAYFGRKDLQQVTIIKHLVEGLSFNTEIIECDTFREDSGLAMSSRNERLSAEGKEKASYLYQGLLACKEELLDTKEVSKAYTRAEKFLTKEHQLELEYLEICDTQNLQPLTTLRDSKEVAICLAAYVESVRLIDNIIVKFV